MIINNNIGILNFGFGNLKSIIEILKKMPFNINIYLINNFSNNLENIHRFIIPGQGSSFNWVKNYFKFNFFSNFSLFLLKPIMGICVGEHIFFNKSYEGNFNCLNFLKDYIKKFKFSNFDFYKIPHIGWNKIYILKYHLLLNNIFNKSFFYFSHSYYLCSRDSSSIYSFNNFFYNFPSIFIKNNLFLLQFHPEKSGFQGYNIFYNFCNWKF